MHELSVTQSILEIALRHAEQAGAARISTINLTIGQLSSVIDNSVQFYWDMIAKGTIAEGAKLVFKRIPTQLLCLDCELRYQPGVDEFDCPDCGSARVKVVAGMEFFLESIDVV
jgi:hydrogenase nickel incorporation protein HypA/HybF